MPAVRINGKRAELSEIGPCPECGVSWDAGRIFDKLRALPDYDGKTDDEIRKIASMYGDADGHFSRLIGVEIRGAYDGVLYWECPDCHKQWHRADIRS
jgi:hypothetical protein